MHTSFILLVLISFQSFIYSVAIDGADGCIYAVVPNKNFKFMFRIAGNAIYEKDCPDNHVFDKDRCGCIPFTDAGGSGPGVDVQTTADPYTGPLPTTSIPSVKNCNLKEDLNNESSYMVYTNQGWKSRPCGKGTKFQLHPNCNCIHSELASPTCYPEVEIGSLEGEVKGYGSLSRYDVTLTANNVHVDDIGFDFNGSSDIRIDLFNNLDYLSGFTITFEFRESSIITERQVLFTNCDNNTKQFSIEFSLIPGYVKFMIDVGQDMYFAKDVEYTAGGFKKVTAMYDGKQFIAYVDNKMGTIDAPGVIRKRSYPMIIGNTECPNSSGFRGTLRRIRIYRCVKDDGSVIP